MAKQKRPDQHASGLLVRYPESARTTLEWFKREFGQPFTVAALRALADYAAKHGAPPPAPSEEAGK